MFLRRSKSTSPFPPRSLPPFSCSSFKDIQSLFEDNLIPPNSSTLNVFHRTLSAKLLLRSLQNFHQIQENVKKSNKPPKSTNGVVSNVLKRGFSEGNKCFLEDADLLVNDGLNEVDDGVVSDVLDVAKRGFSEGNECCIEDLGIEVDGDLNEVVRNKCVDEDLGSVVNGDVCDDLNEVVRIVPGAETRVVIFFTSLRVVRSTFEDCKYVRTILQSFPVAIDERDLFMDGRFMKELERIMGKDESSCLMLPRVFIGGRYIGGAEEIRRLHEAGELKKCLEGLAPKGVGTCEVCFGHRFVLCVECNGSHKCYVEKGGFRACSGCNENGLVRCSSCCSVPL